MAFLSAISSFYGNLVFAAFVFFILTTLWAWLLALARRRHFALVIGLAFVITCASLFFANPSMLIPVDSFHRVAWHD